MNTQSIYEKKLLARIISDKPVYSEYSDIITPDLFSFHAHIFESYLEIIKEGKQPSIAKLLNQIPEQKKEVVSLVKSLDYNIPIIELISELDEFRKVRILNEAIVKTTGQHDSEGKLQTLTDAITSIYQREKSSYESAYDIAKTVVQDVHNKKLTGIRSGFAFFDSLTGGLQPSDLVIIAAETSQGKTSLALNITQNIIDQGEAVSFISLEMSTKQIVTRLICSKANIPAKEIKSRYPDFESAAADFQGKQLYIADVNNNSSTSIAGLIRSAHMRFGIKVAVVDYLQLISDKTKGSREQEIGQTARMLKNLAKELNINIITLSQLRRPSHGSNHFPTLSRLRDSGQVEEAADLVMFIYRPEVYGMDEYENMPTEGLAELIIAKGRNYGTGKFKVSFEPTTTTFSDRRDRNGAENFTAASAVQEPMPF